MSPGIARPEEFADECHYFALALHARVGGTLAYVANRGRDGGLAVGHVVVTLAEGIHADADGIWREDQLLAAWGAGVVEPTDAEGVAAEIGGKRLSAWARGRIAAADRALDRNPDFLGTVADAMDSATVPRP